MYRLFHEFAHRYDLHTPPGHYRHDHEVVIREVLRVAPADCRLLDVGCGTGVFLEAAIAVGIDGYGIDAAPEMVEVARQRLRDDRVCVQRMQEISGENAFDAICGLSWTIHYCETESELQDVLGRIGRALRSGGVLVLQVANDEQMNGAVNIDCERGPSGEPNDTYFIHRFHPQGGPDHRAVADYVYASRFHGDIMFEQHELRFANPSVIALAMRRAGFHKVTVIDQESISPFVRGTRADISE
jgi:SAM-dependent methyltransferase